MLLGECRLITLTTDEEPATEERNLHSSHKLVQEVAPEVESLHVGEKYQAKPAKLVLGRRGKPSKVKHYQGLLRFHSHSMGLALVVESRSSSGIERRCVRHYCTV